MIKEAYEAGVKYAIQGIAQSRGNVGHEERQYADVPPEKDIPEVDHDENYEQPKKSNKKKHPSGYEPSPRGQENSYGAFQSLE